MPASSATSISAPKLKENAPSSSVHSAQGVADVLAGWIARMAEDETKGKPHSPAK